MNLQTIRNCATALLISGAMVACASGSPPRNDHNDHSGSRVGVVESIDRMDRGTSNGVTGAIVGGVVGGVLGNQVGSGDGKKIATAAGAIGGAVAGSKIQKHNSRDKYRIYVRMNDGDRETFEQTSISGIRVGKSVRIRNGQVIPR